MVVLACDRSEIRPSEARMRNVKHDPVEKVEGFGAKFEVSRFTQADMERPEDGKVNILVGVRDIRVHLLIAVRIWCLDRERIRVKPLCRSVQTGPLVRVAYHVHPLLQAAANVLGVGAVGYRVRQPGTELDNAIDRPSASENSGWLIRRIAE